MSSLAEVRLIDVRGLSYAVRTLGETNAEQGAIVLLHGFAGSSEDWSEVAPALARDGHRVVAVDLPGHGATGIPADIERFGMDAMVRDLCELADVLGCTRAHWAGYSMGGRIALQLAMTSPERAHSLTLESASSGIADAAARAERRAHDEKLALEIESRGVAWFVAHWEELPIFESQRRLPESIRAAQRARRLQNRPAGIAGSLRGAGQGSQRYLGDQLGGVETPTLLLAGALDAKYSALAAGMAATIAGSEFILIPNAGHNIHLESTQEFRRALLDRLHRIEVAPPPPASLPA